MVKTLEGDRYALCEKHVIVPFCCSYQVYRYLAGCFGLISGRHCLKELRRDKGLCQAEVGAYFGISGPMYCLYENGDRRMRLEMLCALADLFGTSTDYLLGRTRNSKPYPKCKNQR